MREPGATAQFRRVGHALRIEGRTWVECARHGFPRHLIRYPGGIGDDLLCTAVARELKVRDPDAALWILSQHPELYLGNQDLTRALDYARHYHLWYAPSLRSRRLLLDYTRERSPALRSEEDLPPSEHLIAAMCRRAGIRGDVALRPYFEFSDRERAGGCFGRGQVALQCIGPLSGAAMLNKLWEPARIQELADRLRLRSGPKLTLVQVGGAADHRLEGVIDLRGATSIRETAAVLFHSTCFVGTVGFLMHLARAVACRSVIVYGGRERAWQSGYPCNENLESEIECAPCWRWNSCPRKRACLDRIGVDQVEQAVLRVLGMPREAALEVTRVAIDGDCRAGTGT